VTAFPDLDLRLSIQPRWVGTNGIEMEHIMLNGRPTLGVSNRRTADQARRADSTF
jgi:hypothetical protein